MINVPSDFERSNFILARDAAHVRPQPCGKWIVDDLLPRLLRDPELGLYWKGKCTDSLKRDRQLFVDFLGSSFGGPVTYLGRDMKTSHDGLGITEREWHRFIEHVVATLQNLAIAAQESREVVAAAESLKGDVVKVSPAIRV